MKEKNLNFKIMVGLAFKCPYSYKFIRRSIRVIEEKEAFAKSIDGVKAFSDFELGSCSLSTRAIYIAVWGAEGSRV